MLIEIGYINSFNDYRDEKVESILKSIEGLRANEALSTILKSEDTYKGMEGIGIVEAYKYYKTILRKVINKENYNNKIFCFQCHKSSQEADGIEKVNYSICAYSEEPKDNVQLYLFSAKEGRFLECDLLKLDELQKQGLVLGKTGRENGIRKLKKIIKNEKTQSDENTK
jgi:hypothetical protein